MRTTIDIDDPILRELKRLQQRASAPQPPAFRWTSQPMAAHIDLRDQDAVRDRLDGTAAR